MSSVVIQVGQCGNQIGQQLWDTYMKDNHTDKHAFLHADGKLRCIHVDTEPKVIQRLASNCQNSHIRSENTIMGKKGRGANWALGYHGPRGCDNVILRAVMEALRREVERCDSFLGVISLHSLSGGTGSGLGSRLCETIRDTYPMQYQLHCVVGPHAGGESPLQHYNSLLCLSSLHRHSDAVCLFSNDEWLRLASARLKPSSSHVSLSAINHQIVSALWGLLLPAESTASQRYCSIGSEPWALCRTICPMPSLNFMHLHHVQKSKISWENLAGNLCQSLTKRDASGKPYVSLGNVCVCRGHDVDALADCQHEVERRLKLAYHCVAWNPRPTHFWTDGRGVGSQRSMTVASNSTLAVSSLTQVVSRAGRMWHARAFVHHYLKWGATEDDFCEAFNTLQTVICDYKEAVT